MLIPEEEIKRRVPRRSLVLFHDPDDDTMVTCLDGSNKYSRSEREVGTIINCIQLTNIE